MENIIVPDWIWIFFTFAFGCCVGSFLNVVIYRLPRDKSLVKPPSECPSCGAHIRFYDNIPLLSWIFLGARCRYCKAPIRPRYFVIELLTGLSFLGLYFLYFHSDLRSNIPPFLSGGWLIYLISVVLVSMLIAASAIDLELWVIPISMCWLVTAAALVTCAIAGFLIDPKLIRGYRLFPYASPDTGALAAGAAIGTIVSIFLLTTGLLKRSYEQQDETEPDSKTENDTKNEPIDQTEPIDQNGPIDKNGQQGTSERTQNVNLADIDEYQRKFNHRFEVTREIVFLIPIIACSAGALILTRRVDFLHGWWLNFVQRPVAAGLLGSLWGYFVGCAVVWATRILGTFAFGREAMGLGDVHLMGAAGAVVGPWLIVAAFFIAPFFGLVWAFAQMFFKKTRQIPYGPFLSMGVVSVIILHSRIYRNLAEMFFNL